MPPRPLGPLTLGVEEEYQIVDPLTRELCPEANRLLSSAPKALGEELQLELHQSQIEIATPVCQTLTDVRAELMRLRGTVIAAAERAGCRIAAAGTHPFSHWRSQPVTPKDRYEDLVADYKQLMREQVIFGCHIHVGMRDRDLAIQVMNRARHWLSPMLALAANSPYWLGLDTGYACFRTELWSRWPIAGPPQCFNSYAEYQALVQALIATDTVRDGTKIYWDMRLSERFETIEFRVTDVCATIDEAVMITGLVRALVQTCYEQVIEDQPLPAVRSELIRAAHWRAARDGLEGMLIDVSAQEAVPAPEMIQRFLTFLRPALEDQGDWEEVSALVNETLRSGNGATRQRQAFRQAGRLEDVVDHLIAETAKGIVPMRRSA